MKKSNTILFISVFVIVAGLFATLFIDSSLGTRIAEIVTVSTAVIGAVAIYLQFKRDKEINEANFLLEFWKNLSQDDIQKIMIKCDESISNENVQFTPEDYPSIIKYAQWLEALSGLVNRKVLHYDIIDNMFNYIFFVFVNNKHIQQIELLPNKIYYQGIYRTYQSWTKYLRNRRKHIMLEQNSLFQAWNNNDGK